MKLQMRIIFWKKKKTKKVKRVIVLTLLQTLHNMPSSNNNSSLPFRLDNVSKYSEEAQSTNWTHNCVPSLSYNIILGIDFLLNSARAAKDESVMEYITFVM